jgi:cytochrome c556
MKTVHWLFIVSVALFVSGIGFVIAGARSARQAPAVDTTAISVTPVASVKQIMKGIVGPAATVVFDAVSTTVSIKGIEEKAPQTDAEWEALGNTAAALSESGNLMLTGGRAVDKEDWVKESRAMIDAGKAVLKATQDKSPNGVLAAGEALNESCDNCHRKYQRGS